ncbi:MAG: branched-chain amino acid ABC transporter permease [Acidimicrobiia bacterium]
MTAVQPHDDRTVELDLPVPPAPGEADGTGAQHRPGPLGWAARGLAWAALAWVVLCYPGNVLSPFDIPAFDANRMSEAVIFAIIGLSLNVLIGYAGQVSLGHQAFVGIGAFTSAYVVTDLTQEVVLGVLVAALVGAAQAVLLGLVSLRLTGLYFALVTLVYGVMAQQSIFAIEAFTGGTAGKVAPRPTGFESDFAYYYFALIGLAAVLLVDWRLLRTKGGRALLALRENPRVAQTWGIDTKAYTLFAFGVAGLFAGLGGGLLAHRDLQVVANPFDFNLALVFVLMTTIGGLRNRVGVVLGSAFFAFLRNGYLVEKLKLEEGIGLPLVDVQVPGPLGAIDMSPEFAPLVFGPILLLVVLTRLPGGFGQLVRPFEEWLAGRRFRWVPAEEEVIVNDVRA